MYGVMVKFIRIERSDEHGMHDQQMLKILEMSGLVALEYNVKSREPIVFWRSLRYANKLVIIAKHPKERRSRGYSIGSGILNLEGGAFFMNFTAGPTLESVIHWKNRASNESSGLTDSCITWWPCDLQEL
ncbi:17072_t:CDS:2 [Funneliformis caledonium]|uniref:17072_t:CDS:1 n=1 Tax=Funneliformis caledonium TaxID=1117310 RepID=A0A9N9E9A4_9GLOM|nr:17072_t:CDS:2 [Funneliformis caledonium]